MALTRGLNDSEIASLLQSVLEDSNSSENVSESENELLEDDIQSDVEDESLDGNESGENIASVQDPNQEFTTHSDSRIITVALPTLRSKSKHCWTTSKGNSSTRTSLINIVRTARGPTRGCKSLYEPILCFKVFFTDEIISEIVQWTNAEIYLNRRIDNASATFRDTCADEIRAVLGILTLTAALNNNHLSTDDLFNNTYCGTLYTATMSRDRFDFLIRYLRMDDKALRPALRPTDAFAPVRKIWDIFIRQCNTSYIPGSHVTIDEQLLGFRGRCPFKIYIPNKPNKYGIKIPMICDSTTKYMFNAIPYLGKTTNTAGLPLGEFYVKELSRPIHGIYRNITCDNWFTSIPLAKGLLNEPYKLTLVGTIRSNKREIPEEIKNTRARKVGTTMFCYDGPLTLLSYKPKPSKMVYLLSSCNEKGTIDDKTGKPDIILYYNETKGGVDTFDQMCSLMSCSRKTNRWPMAVFYGMLNAAFINSYVIYAHNLISIKKRL
ncbi:piggyBac transposable element-derived protein 4-like [Musca domestica]|uniref:PiggyBac transposable element-derived protein 4-like n=1 Tax=Musca domestica TaxID=7370 RepID=A0ABM3VCG4_MUSDO|nr:piggyBac transposable element-derived protein 4-like [Musca domestica]